MDTLKQVQELRNEIERIKGSQWISVEDQLPIKQGYFLVHTPESFPKNIPFQVAEFYDDNNIFYNEYDEPLEDATHWQPLPVAPGEK